jgi:hypothetical protein
LNNPLRYTDPNGQYEEDVHYDLTRVLAYAAGFSLNDATRIADETQGPDKPGDPRNPMTVFGVEAREKYHFTTEARRQEMWDDFADTYQQDYYDEHGHRHEIERVHPVRALGEYLHALEDKFSHEVYGALLGQAVEVPKSMAQLKSWNQAIEDAHRADYTDTDPDKANTMAKTTFDALKRAANVVARDKHYNVDGRPVLYDTIKGLIDQFNKESDRDKKRQILDKVIEKIKMARRLHESYQD